MDKHRAAPRLPIDRRGIGQRAEDLAAAHLVAQGLQLLDRNFRRRLGELDLVARDGDVLVVAEVRTRADDRFGGAAASVDGWKRRRIVRATQQLLQQRRELARLRVRFDVVVVRLHEAGGEVEWIRHAFEA
jgi:putative endonuclease